jgi:hypothetical protein
MRVARRERSLDPTQKIADDARMMRTAIACGLFMAVAACGNDGTGNNPDGGGSGSDGGSAGMDAFVPEPGYTKLISRTWTVPPGSADTYKCVRVTLTEDTWLTNIMAQAPLGTHHTVLSIASGNGTAGPDGEQDCGVGTLGMVMLYASGVGTSPLDFPTDVGVKIPAGSQIHLNLHLFNASDELLTGESGIWVKQQPTAPPIEAEMVFAGTTSIFLPAPQNGNPPQPQTVSGGCTATALPDDPTRAFTLFAIWPHMHVIATHQKVELTRGGNTMTLHDMPFHFEEQNYYKKDPMVEVLPGDQIRVTCTYLNTTGQLVTIGDGSNQEMCFSGLYRYPARNAGLFQCSQGPGL